MKVTSKTMEQFLEECILKSFPEFTKKLKIKVYISEKLNCIKLEIVKRHFLTHVTYLEKATICNHITNLLDKYKVKWMYGVKGFINKYIDLNCIVIEDTTDPDELSFLFCINK